MIEDFVKIAQQNPEILVFLSLAAGYAIGKIKVKGFGLGSTASVLIAAMVFGQISIEVPGILKSISFALFAFCIGYQVGPQFFGALRKEGLNYLWISLVVAFAGLITAVILGKILHFDPGTTAGLFAGSMTQSAAIGTAQGAVEHLKISGADKALLNGNIAIAYAITYIFGTVGVIFLFKILPNLMRINIKDEAEKLEKTMGGLSDTSKNPELFSWSKQVEIRAYKASNAMAVGKTVSDVEKLFFPARNAINRIIRGDSILEARQDMIVNSGDILVATGKHTGLVNAQDYIGHEIDVSTVVELIGESLEVCVLNPEIAGKTLEELARYKDGAHGVFLRKITRQGSELPILSGTVINKCDIIQLVGEKSDVDRVAKVIGYAEKPTSATDLLMVGMGCAIGTLIGLLVLPVAGIPITLGSAGGILFAGLVFGWLRSKRPTFGRIPEGGQWLLNDLGLNLFIACIGLASGRQALHALQTSGLSVFLAGAVLAIIPIIIGLIFGRYLLKMNPVLLLGALTGARVIPAALNTLQDDAESNTPVIGFAAPFAFANVFLTVMGSVIINIM